MAMQNTFRIPAPESVQSLGGSGYAPFGNPVGFEPQFARPVVLPVGKQPTYVMKIDVTPVNVTSPPPSSVGGSSSATAPVKYTVSGPGGHGHPVTEQSVIGHALPHFSAISGQPGQPGAIQVKQVDASTLHSSESITIQPSVPIEKPRAVTGVYSGTNILAPCDLIPDCRGYPNVPVEGVNAAQPQDGVDPSAEAAGLPYSRSLTHIQPEFNAEDRSRVYSWITPAGEVVEDQVKLAEDAVGTAVETKQKKKKTRRGKRSAGRSEFLPWFARLCQPATRKIDEADPWGTADAEIPQEAGDEFADANVGTDSSPNEESNDDGVIRPSVIYGGCEPQPPKYCGKLNPHEWKLHAIEIHQYIPIPGVKDPAFLEMALNPETDPLYGAIPLPFDPEKTGMTALTIQDILDGRQGPKLAPALTQLFNQELPALFVNRDGSEEFLSHGERPDQSM